MTIRLKSWQPTQWSFDVSIHSLTPGTWCPIGAVGTGFESFSAEASVESSTWVPRCRSSGLCTEPPIPLSQSGQQVCLASVHLILWILPAQQKGLTSNIIALGSLNLILIFVNCNNFALMNQQLILGYYSWVTAHCWGSSPENPSNETLEQHWSSVCGKTSDIASFTMFWDVHILVTG